MYNVNGIGSIVNMINTQDIAIIGIFENLGYFTLLIISIETIMLNIEAVNVLYNPLKYNVANINEIPGIGNPIKPLILMWSAITLYLVNLKTPQTIINKLTSITINCSAVDVVFSVV